jgi:hypothetical protein
MILGYGLIFFIQKVILFFLASEMPYSHHESATFGGDAPLHDPRDDSPQNHQTLACWLQS